MRIDRLVLQAAVVTGLGAATLLSSPKEALADPPCFSGCCLCVEHLDCDDDTAIISACQAGCNGGSFNNTCFQNACSAGYTFVDCGPQ